MKKIKYFIGIQICFFDVNMSQTRYRGTLPAQQSTSPPQKLKQVVNVTVLSVSDFALMHLSPKNYGSLNLSSVLYRYRYSVLTHSICDRSTGNTGVFKIVVNRKLLLRRYLLQNYLLLKCFLQAQLYKFFGQ